MVLPFVDIINLTNRRKLRRYPNRRLHSLLQTDWKFIIGWTLHTVGESFIANHLIWLLCLYCAAHLFLAWIFTSCFLIKVISVYSKTSMHSILIFYLFLLWFTFHSKLFALTLEKLKVEGLCQSRLSFVVLKISRSRRVNS